MLHTVHLFYELDSEQYGILFNAIKKMSKLSRAKFYKRADGVYQSNLFQRKGITLELKQLYQKGYSALQLVLNPIRLLKETNYIQLTKKSHAKSICRAFKEAFSPLKKELEKSEVTFDFKLNDLDAYNFKRVDFSINVYTEYIKQYMQLIQRANIPDGFIQYEKYDYISKRKKTLPGSFYIFRRDKDGKPTLTINCYDKGAQLSNEKLVNNDALAKQTIRFEVQCRYKKIYDIIQKIRNKACSNPDISLFEKLLDDTISDHVLMSYFRKTIGLGDYYTLSKAKERIKEHRLPKKTEENLTQTLILVSEKRGVWKARETVTDPKNFDRNIEKLHDLAINPVTIPVNWDIEYLPCLYQDKNTDTLLARSLFFIKRKIKVRR